MDASLKPVYNGRKQIVLCDGDMEAHIAPEKGARIIQMKKGNLQILYRVYPHYVKFGSYLEYGGVEYLLGSAPGSIYDRKFDYELLDDHVRLWCFSRDILFEKLVTLKEPFLDIRYSFVNFSERFTRFTFSIHPEIAIGNFKDCVFSSRSESGEEKDFYQGPGRKRYFKPGQNWYTVTNPQEDVSFVVVFPANVIDRVEVYYPQADTHICPQLMVDSVGLCPQRKASYRVKFGILEKEYGEMSDVERVDEDIDYTPI